MPIYPIRLIVGSKTYPDSEKSEMFSSVWILTSKTGIDSENVNCIKHNIIKYMDSGKCILLCIMHMDGSRLFWLPASKLH